MTGIVSEHLTHTLSEDIRTKGLLVWLDRGGVYSDYVDALVQRHAADGFPYPVFSFRGSFVELMRESYPALAGAQLPRCVIHLPGLTEDSVKRTPLYEAYRAGHRWRIALETVIRDAGQGHLTPKQLDSLVARDDLTLDVADRFLADHVDTTPELRPLVTNHGEDGLVAALLTSSQALAEEFTGDEAALTVALLQRLERHVGMDQEWINEWIDDSNGAARGIDRLVEAVWAFLLCREYATDLAGSPPSKRLGRLRELPREYHRAGTRILDTLRRHHAEAYATRAEEVASALSDTETNVSPGLLGTIDTFRFEADIFLAEAFRLLDAKRWTEAGELERIHGGGGDAGTHTFWVHRDRNLMRTWRWVGTAAALGQVLAEAPEVQDDPADLALQTKTYCDLQWKTDRLHRKFTLQSADMSPIGIDTHMPAFSRVRSELVRAYRNWIDAGIRAWNAACERDGFLPDAAQRQRGFFWRYIAPALRSGTKTAVILADALRYDLGRELEERLTEEHLGVVEVGAMLAELPTITAVGMGALAPSADGDELLPVFSSDESRITGFRGGARAVTSPSSREKTFAEVSGVTCGWQDLNAFLALDEKPVKRIAENELLIVATDTVDHEGEVGALSSGIDYFDKAIGRIVTATLRLIKLGYGRIVVTADHGFIIGDDGVLTGRAAQLPRADRRYVLGEPRFGEEFVSVRLPELQYRTDSAQRSILFDRTSHLLSSRPAGSFYHGGNSPQERIIPVLTIAPGTIGHRERGTYRLSYEALPDVVGLHRIRITAAETSPTALFEKEPLDVRIVADDNAVVVNIADVSGGGAQGDLVRLEAGKPCEIYFNLRGSNPRARLRFVSARSENTIENPESPEYFDIDVRVGVSPDTETGMTTGTSSTLKAGSWQEFVDEIYHPALLHLANHGALSERYLINTLGGHGVGARKARRFARKIDEWQPYLPFRVTVHESEDGKEYRTS